MKTFKSRFRPSRRSFLKSSGALVAGLTFLPRHSLSQEEKRLNFYNWDTYIGETTLEDFQGASGIEVQMDLFADNEELFAKLRAGNPGYDVIVPTNNFVERMILAEMLMPLDHDKIPNMNNIDAPFRDAAFDPGRKHSLPYMWGTMGIGYRTSRVDGPIDSWGAVMEGEKHSGRISLLGDAENVLGCALKYLGYSFNSTDAAEIKQVEEMLIANKRHIKMFAPDTGQDLLIAGEVDLCQEWNGDILQVMEEDDDLAYVVPKEGTLLWEDCLAIPTGAPHPDNAHAFLNYLLDAEVGAEIADYIQYASPNAAAKALMSEAYTGNPSIFPTDEIIARSEASVYLGEGPIRMRDEAWTRIQAA